MGRGQFGRRSGEASVGGISLTPDRGLGSVVVPQKEEVYKAPVSGPNSPEAIAKQVELANLEAASRSNGVAWKGPKDGMVTTTAGKKVANTVLGDSDYMRSLKISTAEGYNAMLAKKAFHPGNAEAKAIAKKLGINQNGTAKVKRKTSAEVAAKKKADAIKVITEDPTMENPIAKSIIDPNAPVGGPLIAAPTRSQVPFDIGSYVDNLAFGGNVQAAMPKPIIPMGDVVQGMDFRTSAEKKAEYERVMYGNGVSNY